MKTILTIIRTVTPSTVHKRHALNLSTILKKLVFVLVFANYAGYAQQSGIFESYVILDNGFGNQQFDLFSPTDTTVDTPAYDYSGSNFGTIGTQNGTLILNGGQNNVWKCYASDDITSGWLNYRLYPSGSPTGGWTGINLNGNVFDYGTACSGSGTNQSWIRDNANINLLSGLASGDYTLEVYSNADYTYNSGANSSTHYVNNNGNNFTATFRADNPPTASCHDLTVYLDGTGNISITATDIDAGSTDDFDVPTLSINIDTFDCSNIGSPVTVTLTAEDSLGQTSTCTSSVTVIDNIPPTATNPNPITIDCLPIPSSDITVVTDEADNCGTPTVINMGGTLSGDSCSGTFVRTYRIIDGSGNYTEVTQTITIQDNVPPTASNPAPITIECASDIPVPDITVVTDESDNCSTATVAFVSDVSDGNFNPEIITRTYSVTDDCGNSINVTQTITIDDVTNPVISLTGNNPITIEACAGYIDSGATASDNCDGDLTASLIINSAVNPNVVGTYYVTYDVFDSNGNNATQIIRTVVVEDSTPPTITLVGDNPQIIEACNSYSELGASATDPCFGDISGSIVADASAVDTSTVGTYQVTYNVTDAQGNVATEIVRTIYVEDTSPPTITLVGDNPQVIEACDSYAELGASATDPCFGDISGNIFIDASGVDTATVGTYQVTYNVMDANSNAAIEVIRTVVVQDNTAPTIVLSGANPQVIEACDSYTELGATATDPCFGDISGSIVVDASAVDTSTVGTYQVTYDVMDANGNAATQIVRTIYVEDTSPPTITLVGDNPQIIEACDSYAELGATATDPCFGDISGSIAVDASAVDTATVGTYQVTYNVMDANGNAAVEVIRSIVIEDNTAPTIVLSGANPQVIEACDSYTELGATATDPCFGDISGSIVADASAVDTSTVGTYQVTYNVMDANSNAATEVIRTVVVQDNTAPTIVLSGANPQVIEACDSYIELGATATDPCFGDISGSIVVDASAVDTATVGTYQVTYNVMDANSNVAVEVIRTVNIVDTISPSFTSCSSDITLSNDPGLCGAVVNFANPTATDSCGSISVTQSDSTGLTSGDLFPVGVTSLEFTADDGNGNSVICSFTVTINDTEVPTINCPIDVTANADSNCEATSVSLGTPTTNDNCGIASVTNNAPSTYPLGTTPVIWTVTDLAGNSTTCIQNVTIEDTTPPTITCPSNITVTVDPGLCTALVINLGTPTINDNCGAGYTNDAPTVFPIGDTIVTWTATDGNGNTATCTQTVTVNDNEAPTASCQNLSFSIDSVTTLPIIITASDIDNGSFDNCGSVSLSLSQTSFDCSDIGSNTVVLTVTDTAGNSSTCNATVTITDAAAGASVSISSSPTTPICQGTSVTFTAAPVNGGASPTYQWYLNGNPVGTNSASYTTSTLDNSDQVYVEMTSSQSPCATPQQSNIINMTVNPTLPVTFTLNASANPICSGNNTTFFITNLINGGSNPSYQWYINSNPVGGNTNTYSSTSIADGDVVSVEVTSNATCASPVPQIQSVTMTVNPLPNVTALANGSSTNITICEGDSLILTGSGASTYTWNNGAVNGVSFIPTVGTHTYSVTGTNANGCFNTDTITVTVNPNATINLTSGNDYQGVCRTGGSPSGTVENIIYSITGANTVTVTGLPNGVNYNYNSTTGILTIGGNPDNNQGGIYPYTVTANGTCTTATTNGEITIYTGIPSTPSQVDGPTVVCPVSTVTYSVNDNDNVAYYTWTMPNGEFQIQSGQGTNEITVLITETDFSFFGYDITVTAINDCGSSQTRTKTVYVSIDSYDIDAGNDIYVCAGTTQIAMDGYVGGLSYNEWDWDDNGAGGSFSTQSVLIGQTWSWSCWCNVDQYGNDMVETSTYTIPSSAQPGDVITISLVADNGLLCPTVSDDVHIYILEPTDAEITSADTTICQGDSTTITFEGTPNSQIRVDGVWYNLGSDGLYSMTVSPSVTTTYFLDRSRYQASTFPGNNNCPTPLNESVTITVNAPPTVNAGSNISICSADTVTLAGSLGGDHASGSWSTNGSGTFSNNTPTAVYTPSATDIFNGTVTLTYTNTPSDGICSAVSDSMIVTINSEASVYAGIDQTICSNAIATMTASISGGATSGVWSTSGSGIFSSNMPNATYTPGVGETGTITLTYTTNDPSGPCGPAIDSMVLTITPEATVNAGTNVTICEGDMVSLSGSSYGGGATSATWSTSGTGSFSSGNYTPSAADIANGSVTLTYTTNNPAGPCGAVSATKTVTINKQPSVDAGLNQTICSTVGNINLNATVGSGTSGAWSTSGDGSFNNSTLVNATYTPGTGDLATGNVTLTFTSNSAVSPCSNVSDSVTYSIIPSVSAVASITVPATDCNAQVTLTANGSGQWSAVSVPTGSSYSFSNINDPNAIFIGESDATYNITWTLLNTSPCSNTQATISNVYFPACANDVIDFDGSNDNIDFEDNFNLSGDFSLELWIKPNVTDGNIKTILSKRNADNVNTGYDLRYVNNTIQFRWNGSGQISANNISTNRWYHVALTHNGSTYRLYIDGILRTSTTGSAPTSNTMNFLLGAMDRLNSTPTNFFDGWMDELRIWNVALSIDQIHEMMNQEIEDNGLVRGSTLGLDITGLNWSNLLAYYQMNQSTDLSGGYLANIAGGINGKLKNILSTQEETAPLPYVSITNGSWDNATTWNANSLQQIPNTNGTDGSTPVSWNIVRTQHDVNSNRQVTVLGLLVDNNTYSVENDQALYVNKYLKINSVLDLVGESQLLQPNNSIVDYTGTGRLEIDQQGTSNLFNYNYWGSPVSSNGSTYTIGSSLYDGNNPVQWTSGYDGSPTSPVTLSRYWLYLYENYPIDSYADWHSINETSNISVGLGYSMKGSGAATANQNYTFRGQPNNGSITSPITTANEALVGNPYPSAIDSHQFINENASSITGSIYYWEHAPSNNSHYLSAYQGGYAIYNLLGGVAAVSPPEINGVGNANKIPKRYIPVAQGFMVRGSNNGNITFNNSQRIFVKESGSNSLFMRNSSDLETVDLDENEPDDIKRIRIDFVSAQQSKRHLLLGFTPKNEATPGVDFGYDALNTEDFPSDMSFVINNDNYIIQGVGAFDENSIFPISLKLNAAGPIKIKVTDVENFEDDIDVFLYDALLETYTPISHDMVYNANLSAGVYNNRFFITFKIDESLDVIDNELSQVQVNYLHQTDEIYIKVPESVNLKQVYLINMLGQTVKSWNATNATLGTECKLPVKNISEGNYIVKVQTDSGGTTSKKVVIKL